MIMFKRTSLVGAVLALMVACGGGGGDAGQPLYGGGSGTGGGTGDGGGTGGGTGGGGSQPGGGISDVSTNAPSQKSISISAEKYALDWSVDGETTTITVRVTDTAGNPVPEGATVQFSTEGGQIQTSCRLSGATSGASTISACSVTFATQNRRPSDGYVSVLAWLEGEEAYVDLNGNGRYDVGEPYWDSGRLFRDDNENGVYDLGIDELNLGSSASGSPGIGTAACVQPDAGTYGTYLNAESVPLSVPDTCDGQWGRTIIRTRAILPVSDPRFMGIEPTGTPGFATLFAEYGSRRTAAPAGTALSVQGAPSGCTVSVSPAQVSDGAVVPTTHRLSGTGTTCSGANVTVVAKFRSYEVNTIVTMP